MKAIFNGLSLRRVLGLAERNNAELRRMVEAYASERRAAGRPVPEDVDFHSRRNAECVCLTPIST